MKMGVDLVLIQEPRAEKEKDGMRSHPSFMFIRGEESEAAKCWIAVNWSSRCRVTELKDLMRGRKKHVHSTEASAGLL